MQYNPTYIAFEADVLSSPLNTEYTKIANAVNQIEDDNIGTPLTGAVLNLTSPGNIGGTTPNVGTFTTLTATTLVISGAIDFNNNFSIKGGHYLRVYDVSDTKYTSVTHDGSDGVISTSSGSLSIFSSSGSLLVNSAGGTEYVSLRHNDSNAYIETSTGAVYVTTVLGVQDGNPLRIYDSLNIKYIQMSNDGSDGHIFVLSGDVLVDSNLRVTTGKTFQIFDVANTKFATFSHDGSNFILTVSSGNFYIQKNTWLRGGSQLRVYDVTDTDNLSFYHSGGVGVIIASAGDIQIIPEPAHYVSFGGWTSAVDNPVDGYISVKDSSGNIRKLATIS